MKALLLGQTKQKITSISLQEKCGSQIAGGMENRRFVGFGVLVVCLHTVRVNKERCASVIGCAGLSGRSSILYLGSRRCRLGADGNLPCNYNKLQLLD